MPRNRRGSNYEVISMGGEFGIFILELGFQPPVMSHGKSEIHFYGAIGHLSGNHFFLYIQHAVQRHHSLQCYWIHDNFTFKLDKEYSTICAVRRSFRGVLGVLPAIQTSIDNVLRHHCLRLCVTSNVFNSSFALILLFVLSFQCGCIVQIGFSSTPAPHIITPYSIVLFLLAKYTP